MKKKMLMLLPLMMAPFVLSLTGCSKKTKIGILQFDEFPALDAARKGFEDGLREGGVNSFSINFKNGGGVDADLQLYAKDLVDTCELTLGIATPAAKALKGASDNAGYTKPVLYTAVTDPVAAGLIASKDNPSGYVCGTSDANPVAEQIGLVKEFKATAAKVGDEIDSGLDVDAINTVSDIINEEHERGAGLLVISHYARLLDLIKPTRAVILINGKIVVDGGPEIIKRVDTEGYEWIKNELGIEIAKEINAPMNEVSIGVCATREAVKNEK